VLPVTGRTSRQNTVTQKIFRDDYIVLKNHIIFI
jgi:hypothetical protein